MPNMERLGLFHMDGIKDYFPQLHDKPFEGVVARLAESSRVRIQQQDTGRLLALFQKTISNLPNGFRIP